MALKKDITGMQDLIEEEEKIKKQIEGIEYRLKSIEDAKKVRKKKEEIKQLKERQKECKEELKEPKEKLKQHKEKRKKLEKTQKKYLNKDTLIIDSTLCNVFTENAIGSYGLGKFFGDIRMKEVKNIVYKGGNMMSSTLAGCSNNLTLKIEPTTLKDLSGLQEGCLLGMPGVSSQPVKTLKLNAKWLKNTDLGEVIVKLNEAGIEMKNLEVYLGDTKIDILDLIYKGQALREKAH